jgi:hypothetical protein
VQRALVDYDFGASGIWMISSRDDTFKNQNKPNDGEWSGARLTGAERVRPWSNVLTESLLDELQRWNDWGCRMARSSSDGRSASTVWISFYQSARVLAEKTQLELGDGWQVLWMENGAWNFVRSPWTYEVGE